MSHYPRRDDDVATWIKARRDDYDDSHSWWWALDELLEDYRLHADTGTPLGQHACDGPGCSCGANATTPSVSVRTGEQDDHTERGT